MDNRDVMRIHADTLFTYDGLGRMLLTNEPRPPDRRPAPCLFLGRTTAGHVVRFGAAVPDDVAQRLERIVADLPPIGDLCGPPADVAAVREALGHYASVTEERSGPAFYFPATLATRGDTVQVTSANVALARNTFPWLLHELADCGPCYAVVRNGEVVSACFSARISAVAAEAGVETLPAFRGRGYAGAVTAAWGAAVRATGRIPLYSTACDNLASQGAARRVGLIMFGADVTWA